MLQNNNNSPHNHILPSPARLGVLSPPQPPPQNPNKPPQSSPSNAILPVGGDMVSLLPPLPRAQSLLHQMASLSSSLFDLSPHRSHWSSSYRSNPPTFLSSPLPSSSSSAATSTSEALSLLSSLQSSLSSAVSSLSSLSSLHSSSSLLSTNLSSLDSSLLSFSTNLHNSHQILSSLLDDYKHSLHPHPSLDLDDLLAYSHRISYTTFAPPDASSSLPPAPQDSQMRASILYQFVDLDVGVPKTVESVAGQAEEVLMKDVAVPVAVPPTWKLPMELPAMPPGWKPGDPVPMSLLDGFGEQRQPPKAQEAIQVKYVELDIGGDDDDDDSTYDSDTSDEDDED